MEVTPPMDHPNSKMVDITVTDEQHVKLKTAFQFIPIPDHYPDSLASLVEDTGLEIGVVRAWFGNMRKRIGIEDKDDKTKANGIDDSGFIEDEKIPSSVKKSGMCPLDFNPSNIKKEQTDSSVSEETSADESFGSSSATISSDNTSLDTSISGDKDKIIETKKEMETVVDSLNKTVDVSDEDVTNISDISNILSKYSDILSVSSLTLDSSVSEDDTADKSSDKIESSVVEKAEKYDGLKEEFDVLKNKLESLTEMLSKKGVVDAAPSPNWWTGNEWNQSPSLFPPYPPYYNLPYPPHQQGTPYHPPYQHQEVEGLPYPQVTPLDQDAFEKEVMAEVANTPPTVTQPMLAQQPILSQQPIETPQDCNSVNYTLALPYYQQPGLFAALPTSLVNPALSTSTTKSTKVNRKSMKSHNKLKTEQSNSPQSQFSQNVPTAVQSFTGPGQTKIPKTSSSSLSSFTSPPQQKRPGGPSPTNNIKTSKRSKVSKSTPNLTNLKAEILTLFPPTNNYKVKPGMAAPQLSITKSPPGPTKPGRKSGAPKKRSWPMLPMGPVIEIDDSPDVSTVFPPANTVNLTMKNMRKEKPRKPVTPYNDRRVPSNTILSKSGHITKKTVSLTSPGPVTKKSVVLTSPGNVNNRRSIFSQASSREVSINKLPTSPPKEIPRKGGISRLRQLLPKGLSRAVSIKKVPNPLTDKVKSVEVKKILSMKNLSITLAREQK